MKTFLAMVFSASLLLAPKAFGLDLPFDIGLRFGFNTTVRPGAKDASRELGLGVVTDRILTDRERSLTITGTLVNYGGLPLEGVEMRFAVTSFTGIGRTLGRAVVEPSVIPPGGSAEFVLRMSLLSPNPQYAYYTITANNFRSAGAP